MAEMRPRDVPAEYVEAGADTIHAHYAANPADESEENAIRILLAAVLPLHRHQIAAELEAHAESIGWYEGGGVWAEALDVIKRKPWTVRDGK